MYEGDTPSPLRIAYTALFWPCVLRNASVLDSRTAYCLTTKTTMFSHLHLHKED